jgi:hypothetical protein
MQIERGTIAVVVWFLQFFNSVKMFLGREEWWKASGHLASLQAATASRVSSLTRVCKIFQKFFFKADDL